MEHLNLIASILTSNQLRCEIERYFTNLNDKRNWLENSSQGLIDSYARCCYRHRAVQRVAVSLSRILCNTCSRKSTSLTGGRTVRHNFIVCKFQNVNPNLQAYKKLGES